MAAIVRSRIAAAIAMCAPAQAWSHAFDDRFDLPTPLSYFIAGAAAVVAVSFLIVASFMRRAPSPSTQYTVHAGPVLGFAYNLARLFGLLVFVITIVAGLAGTADPMMNIAPTIVWIAWWVGLSLFVACAGNVWPAVDPWRTLFDLMNSVVRRLGMRNGMTLGWRYPQTVGTWPAVILLLSIGWFEVVYPQAAVPHTLATVLLVWTAATLTGMVCFGRNIWQRNADVFSVYFATLGRFAPIAPRGDRAILLRPPGSGLIDADVGSVAMVAFIVAMLSTVLFDGLLGGPMWALIQRKLAITAPSLTDSNGYAVGAVGLIGVWLIFLLAYLISCAVTTSLTRGVRFKRVVYAFAYTLVPIAVAYNIAHNASNLVTQGEQLIALASDPLGVKWDLFGTANYRAPIGLIDARITWYIAIGSIVAGHVLSVWLAHRVALREFRAARPAVIASLPLTALMIIYTAISLSVIAEPMVKFETPDAVISE